MACEVVCYDTLAKEYHEDCKEHLVQAEKPTAVGN